MKHGAILITGGAGYIGSHVALQLRARAERVVVLDDLSRGFRQAVLDVPLVVGNVGDRDTVRAALDAHGVDTVMHFAACTVVPESVRDPLKYYGNNTCATRSLLQCCLEGEAEASPLRYVSLRYFNVAGSDSGGRIGQATPNATLLIKVACEAAVGKRAEVAIFGTDYPTPDGTGVRDYIHVEDLAAAHLDALQYLRAGGGSTTLNVGYGHGYSVRQVLASVERVSGKPLKVREEPRRPGDPPALVARAERIRRELGWKPRLDDLDTIVRTGLAWEERLLRNPW